MAGVLGVQEWITLLQRVAVGTPPLNSLGRSAPSPFQVFKDTPAIAALLDRVAYRRRFVQPAIDSLQARRRR